MITHLPFAKQEGVNPTAMTELFTVVLGYSERAEVGRSSQWVVYQDMLGRLQNIILYLYLINSKKSKCRNVRNCGDFIRHTLSFFYSALHAE
jgi:hypothetical protein